MMKHSLFISLFAVALTALLTTNCKKEESPSTTVTDVEGNTYQIVTIGTQTWMSENLKVAKLKDGTAIPNNTSSSEWYNLQTPAYCWYNDSIKYKDVYGALYNWHTVNTGKLCPEGWHVPSEAEWTKLTTYIGGMSTTGGKLKEKGTAHWAGPNLEATNETGFTALPGGSRYNGGSFGGKGTIAIWWTSTASVSNWTAWYYNVYNDLPMVSKVEYPKQGGLSIRCIKN